MSKPLHAEGYVRFLRELRRAREERGISQSDLAKAMGEHQTYVSKVETGVRRLDVVELQRWLSALQLSLTEFAPVLDHAPGVHHLMPSHAKARRTRK